MTWSRASCTSCDTPFSEPWHSHQPGISLPMSRLRSGLQISCSLFNTSAVSSALLSQHCSCPRYWLWPSCCFSRLTLMDAAVQEKSWDCEAEIQLCSLARGCIKPWAIGNVSSRMHTEGCAEMSAHCSSYFPRE